LWTISLNELRSNWSAYTTFMILSEYSKTHIPNELEPNPGSTPQLCLASLFIAKGYLLLSSTDLSIDFSENTFPSGEENDRLYSRSKEVEDIAILMSSSEYILPIPHR
jgi:hypothetical protein